MLLARFLALVMGYDMVWPRTVNVFQPAKDDNRHAAT